MKTWVSLGVMLCCAMSAPYLYAQSEQSLDQIVAVVNDEVVTKSELNTALTSVKMQISQQQENTPAPSEAVLSKQVLDQLINRKLQLQAAKQNNVLVTDTDVTQAIQRIATQNHMSEKELYQRLTSEGMSTKEYRNEIHDQMTMQRMQQKEVVGRVTITPQEIDRFIRANPPAKAPSGEPEYQLDDLIVPLSDAPSAAEMEDAKKRAEAVLAKLNQGQSLQAVAQAETAAGHPLKNNDLGWRKMPEIPTAFADKIAALKKSQVAGPIQTANGFHIVRLADLRTGGGEAAPAPSRKEVEDLLLRRKFEEATKTWVNKLRKQAFISMNPDKKKGSALS